MALKDGMQGREYDKFLADASGNTAVRVMTTIGSGSESLAYATGTYTDIGATELAITGLNNVALDGKIGSWFVFNSGATDAITYKMYASYISGASDWTLADTAGEWDQVGSDISVSAGATKHIPWQNTYRNVTLTSVAGSGTTSVTHAQLYAVN